MDTSKTINGSSTTGSQTQTHRGKFENNADRSVKLGILKSHVSMAIQVSSRGSSRKIHPENCFRESAPCKVPSACTAT